MRSPVDNRSPTSYRLLPHEQRLGTGIGHHHQALIGSAGRQPTSPGQRDVRWSGLLAKPTAG